MAAHVMPPRRLGSFLLMLAALSTGPACKHAALDTTGTASIPEGPFWTGSSLQERAEAVEQVGAAMPRDDLMTWIASEHTSRRIDQRPFHIMQFPVTQVDYWEYMQDSGAPEPWIDETAWRRQDTGYPYEAVLRFTWRRGHPNEGRREHPIVLVSQTEAASYCAWWGARRGGRGELPSELEWEKAARGSDGRVYPWGDRFVTTRANTSESGRDDTLRVGSTPESMSPFGVHDMAGNVFEWTRTLGDGGYVVKGGGWNSPAVAARSAARHFRPAATRHVAIGFRCVLRPIHDPS